MATMYYKMTRKAKRLIILLISFLIISIVLIVLISDNTPKNIQKGSLQYSKELGWINWEHANPESTLKAYHELVLLNKLSIDSFIFNYSQKMKLKIANKFIVAECKESRIIKPFLTVEEEKLLFLNMFISVSESFERFQAQFPNSYHSSFREGDLMGNLISFHIATTKSNIQMVKDDLVLFNSEESFQQFKKDGLGKIKWNALYIDMINPNKTVKSLQTLLTMSTDNIESLSKIIFRKKSIYFENIPNSNLHLLTKY
jgi:hypothetical protein